VLARTAGRAEGVKGISLFVVPKFLVNADGSLGERNDVHCVSIEHKLGIHASPTCVLAFGDKGGAIGYLVGEENRGLEYMFIMMNERPLRRRPAGPGPGRARLPAGAGLRQGPHPGHRGRCARRPEGEPIIHHPDVRRMLMSMKSQIEAMRALAYVVGRRHRHQAHRHPDEAVRAQNQAFVDLMIPVVKGWCTETAIEVTSTACRCTAAWASSRKPARPSTCATRASPRSTKAPPASRPTT
jgi:alkylation response protein AidB-like acyl-CoA dehydrogenase